MKIINGFIFAVSALAFSSSAFAATVNSIEGVLQVNAGSGFKKVARSAEVAPGGSVMVSPEGKAEILYSDGCRIPLGAGSVAVVAPVSPCAKGQAADDRRDDDYSAYYWAAGGVAAAGLGVGIWALTRHKSNNNVVVSPASP